MVYLVADIEKRYCKIGYSNSPLSRLFELQTSSPLTLELLFIIDGDVDTEKQLHYKFIKHHIRGEWFNFNTEILSHIGGMPQLRIEDLNKRKVILETAPQIFHSINPLINIPIEEINVNISNLSKLVLKYLISISVDNWADVRVNKIDKHCNVTRTSVYRIINQLIRSNLIARANYLNCYYINPNLAFKGDRITLVKQYIKSKNGKLKTLKSISKNIKQ